MYYQRNRRKTRVYTEKIQVTGGTFHDIQHETERDILTYVRLFLVRIAQSRELVCVFSFISCKTSQNENTSHLLNELNSTF